MIDKYQADKDENDTRGKIIKESSSILIYILDIRCMSRKGKIILLKHEDISIGPGWLRGLC